MKPILVLGDVCIDVFVYCHCERLCPEAPVPVLDVVDRHTSLGMAGNVHRNILALDFPSNLISNGNFREITKTRYVDIKTNHMFLRIDNSPKIEPIDWLTKIDYSEYSAIIISDYNKGFLPPDSIAYIADHHSLTFLDTKKILGPWADNVTFIKINRKEYQLSTPFITPMLESKIIETLGSEGCRFRQATFRVDNVEIKNLSGAGDAFLAGLVVEYIKSDGNISRSLMAANDIATVVVQKKGIGTIKG